MKISLPKLALGRGSTGSIRTGLVIRAREVDLLSMQGGTVTNRVRVPIEGTEDYHITDAVRKTVEAANLKQKRLAVSIPTQHVLFRFFAIPQVPKNEWESVVQFEARKYIPFKIDWLVWDCRVLPSAVPNKLDVIFSAIQRETFRKMQEVLANAGVQPALIEPRSLSLARLAPMTAKDAPNEFICLVDVEQDSAHLAIVKDHLPYLTRDISFAPSAETSPDAGGMNAEPSSEGSSVAEPLPIGFSGSAETVPPDDGTDPRLKRLFSELSVSMDFFMREYPSTRISRVVMFGEEGQVSAWAGWLAERLQTSVELGNALLDQRIAGQLPLSFAAAVGLLQAGGKTPTMDFLKRSQIKASIGTKVSISAASSAAAAGDLVMALKNPAYVAVGAIIAGLITAGMWLVDSQRLAEAQRQLRQVTAGMPQTALGFETLPVAQLKSLQTTTQAQLDLLTKAVQHQTSVAAKLSGLAQALPEGVWITKLLYEQKMDASGAALPRLAVNGSCYLGEATKELSAIQQFQDQVKRHAQLFEGFASTQLDQINAAKDQQRPEYTVRTFQLNCSASRKL